MSKKSENPFSPSPLTPKKIVHEYFKLGKNSLQILTCNFINFSCCCALIGKDKSLMKSLDTTTTTIATHRERELQCTPNIQISFQYQYILCT